MITVVIEPSEEIDDNNNIVKIPGATLQLEHSLISLQKWEAIWQQPWLDNKNQKTREQTISYIKCMTINKNVSDEVYNKIPDYEINRVNAYINNPMTASKIDENLGQSNLKQLQHKNTHDSFISAELIYYWMIAFHIPFECRKWHLNQLLTLIRVCAAKKEEENAELERETKGNKVNTNWRATAQSFKAENAKRRALWHTKG
jgi:hypothetical protein